MNLSFAHFHDVGLFYIISNGPTSEDFGGLRKWKGLFTIFGDA